MRIIMHIMPRPSIPHTPEVIQARERIEQHFRDTGETINSLAKKLDLKQCTLHRFVKGRTKTLVPTARAALNYVNNNASYVHNRASAAEGEPPPALLAQIKALCNGDEVAATVLTRLVVAICPLVQSHVSKPGTSGVSPS